MSRGAHSFFATKTLLILSMAGLFATLTNEKCQAFDPVDAAIQGFADYGSAFMSNAPMPGPVQVPAPYQLPPPQAVPPPVQLAPNVYSAPSYSYHSSNQGVVHLNPGLYNSQNTYHLTPPLPSAPVYRSAPVYPYRPPLTTFTYRRY
jgi:hypothetical protein